MQFFNFEHEIVCLVSADGHNKFNPNLSSTFRSNGQAVSVIYGGGGMYGIYGSDTVNVRFTHKPWTPWNEFSIILAV